MRVAQIIPCTEAEGPGRRFALWFQGCPLRCPGCCNPEFLPFQGGEEWSIEDMTKAIRQAQSHAGIEGISLLGGEPFAQAAAAAEIARFAQSLGLSVMVYTGYWLEELQARPDPATRQLLDATDLLVDGPYRRELPETQRRWIGSRNQRLHFLTPRYRPDDPCWLKPNTLEVRLNAQGELIINGFPAGKAASLWKGWRQRASLD